MLILMIRNPSSIVQVRLCLLRYAGFDQPSILREEKWAYRIIDEVKEHVDQWGFIRECPGSPNFREAGTSTEMQAFYLMLCAVAEKME